MDGRCDLCGIIARGHIGLEAAGAVIVKISGIQMEGDEIIRLFLYAQIDARLQIGGVVLRPADVVIRPGVDDPVTEILQQRTGLQRDLQRDIFFVDALIPARRSAVISAMSGIDEDRRLLFLLRGDEGINTVCFLRARPRCSACKAEIC